MKRFHLILKIKKLFIKLNIFLLFVVFLIIAINTFTLCAKVIDWEQGDGYIYSKIGNNILNFKLTVNADTCYFGTDHGAFLLNLNSSQLDTLFSGKKCYISSDLMTYIVENQISFYSDLDIYSIPSNKYVKSALAALGYNEQSIINSSLYISDYDYSYDEDEMYFSGYSHSFWNDMIFKCFCVYSGNKYFELSKHFKLMSFSSSYNQCNEFSKNVSYTNVYDRKSGEYKVFSDKFINETAFNETGDRVAISNYDKTNIHNSIDGHTLYVFKTIAKNFNRIYYYKNMVFFLFENQIIAFNLDKNKYTLQKEFKTHFQLSNIEIIDDTVFLGTVTGEFIKIKLDSFDKYLTSEFSADKTNIINGQCVNFVPYVIDSSLTYSWNFGDDSYSSQILPVHQYNTSGYYAVSLNIKNGKRNLFNIKPNYIFVKPIVPKNNSVFIYPNPSNDYINIILNEESEINYWNNIGEIDIYNLLGRKIFTYKNIIKIYSNNNIIKLNISTLPNGIYFLKIGDCIEKFVKR